MGRINSFEEIEAWQNSRMLVSEIHRITKQQKFSSDFGLKDQIQRASVSVMSNPSNCFQA